AEQRHVLARPGSVLHADAHGHASCVGPPVLPEAPERDLRVDVVLRDSLRLAAQAVAEARAAGQLHGAIEGVPDEHEAGGGDPRALTHVLPGIAHGEVSAQAPELWDRDVEHSARHPVAALLVDEPALD